MLVHSVVVISEWGTVAEDGWRGKGEREAGFRLCEVVKGGVESILGNVPSMIRR